MPIDQLPPPPVLRGRVGEGAYSIDVTGESPLPNPPPECQGRKSARASHAITRPLLFPATYSTCVPCGPSTRPSDTRTPQSTEPRLSPRCRPSARTPCRPCPSS